MQYNAQHRSTCKPTVDGKQFWVYFLPEYCILLASNRFLLLQVKHPQWRGVSLSALCHLQVDDTLSTFLASNKEWGCRRDRWETKQSPDIPGQRFHMLWRLLRHSFQALQCAVETITALLNMPQQTLQYGKHNAWSSTLKSTASTGVNNSILRFKQFFNLRQFLRTGEFLSGDTLNPLSNVVEHDRTLHTFPKLLAPKQLVRNFYFSEIDTDLGGPLLRRCMGSLVFFLLWSSNARYKPRSWLGSAWEVVFSSKWVLHNFVRRQSCDRFSALNSRD